MHVCELTLCVRGVFWVLAATSGTLHLTSPANPANPLVLPHIPSPPPQGDIWVDATTSSDGGMVAVSVHDTGIGIPEDKLDDIFAPFAQVGAGAAHVLYLLRAVRVICSRVCCVCQVPGPRLLDHCNHSNVP